MLRSPWERQNLLQTLFSAEEFNLPQNAVKYYVAGTTFSENISVYFVSYNSGISLGVFCRCESK